MDIASRTERVRKMEQLLDESSEAVSQLGLALEKYEAALGGMKELFEYYSGGEWLDDLRADDAGLFPHGLKRGVLSEDAVFDLMAEDLAVRERMRKLAEERQGEE